MPTGNVGSSKRRVHHVKESLITRAYKIICSIILALLFLAALVFFIIWLNLRPQRPRFYVHQLSISEPVSPETTTMFYNITSRNTNQHISIYYDSLHISVLYNDQVFGRSAEIYPFFQLPNNTTVIDGELGGAAVSGEVWREYLAERANGRVVFRVSIRSGIKFRISRWDSRRHVVHANCGVGIGSDGSILPEYRDHICSVYFPVSENRNT